MKYSVIQEQRFKIMLAIAREMAKEDAVLKGGTALLLCYGLDRFSEDMDFDGGTRFSLERAKKLISKAFETINTKVTQIIVKKDTPTTKRFMYHYEVDGNIPYAYPLKIEFSFRQSKELSGYTMLNGVKVYPLDILAEKKLDALLERTAPRDIYDIAFLLEHNLEVFGYIDLESITHLGMDLLVNTFEGEKQSDSLLVDIDGNELVLNMLDNAIQQMRVIEQNFENTQQDNVDKKEQDYEM